MKSTNYPTWNKMLFESDKQKTARLKAEKLAKIQKLAQDANNRNLVNDLFSALLKHEK